MLHVIAFLGLLVAPAISAVIFVDNQLSSDCLGNYSIANRNNTGSDGDAYNTPQKAANISNPGDTIYFRGGVYTDFVNTPLAVPVLRISRSGTTINPISFKNYNNEIVIISAVNSSGQPYKYYAVTMGEEPSDQSDSSGNGVQNIIIEGLILENATRYGIVIFGPANKYKVPPILPASENIIIRHVVARNNMGGNTYAVGFKTKGKVVNALFEYCEAHDNTGGGLSLGRIEKQWHIPEPEDDMSAAQNCIVRNCLFYNNIHPTYPGNTDGISGSHMYQCRFENNLSFNNSDDGIDIYASINVSVKNNISFNHNYPNGNNAGIKFSAGGGGRHLLYGNICLNNKGYSFEGSSPSNPLRTFYPSHLIHNIAYGGERGFNFSGATYTVFPGFEKTYLRNNIALDNPGRDIGGLIATWMDSDYNFISNASDLTNMRAFGHDTHSLTGNPGVVNKNVVIDTNFQTSWTIEQKSDHIRNQVYSAFSLLSDSLLKDAGVLISGFHNSTPGIHVGDLRVWYGSSPDIGAYEYTLTEPSLQVISPNGGEVWRRGETRTITWTANGVTGNLVIELVQDSEVLGTIASSVAASAGSYSWIVGQLISGTCPLASNFKIRIRSLATGQVMREFYPR